MWIRFRNRYTSFFIFYLSGFISTHQVCTSCSHTPPHWINWRQTQKPESSTSRLGRPIPLLTGTPCEWREYSRPRLATRLIDCPSWIPPRISPRGLYRGSHCVSRPRSTRHLWCWRSRQVEGRVFLERTQCWFRRTHGSHNQSLVERWKAKVKAVSASSPFFGGGGGRQTASVLHSDALTTYL